MVKGASEQRRFKRIDVTVPVLVRLKSANIELVTGNISRHGVFMRTDNPLPDRQLVKMRFTIPGSIALEVVGMVARRVLPGSSGPSGPGMGVDFFSIGKDDKKVWDRFCMELERKPELATVMQSSPARTENSFIGRLQEIKKSAPPVSESSAPKQAPVRRRHPRYAATFLIRMRDRGELSSYYCRDISGGGTFLKTTLLKQLGEMLELVLIHPETDQEFALAAKVVRVVDGPTETDQGMGLSFEPLTAAQRDKLEIFIETGVAFLDGLPELEAETQRALQAAAILESNSARVHFEWGKRLLYDLEDFKTAAAEFERALALDPGYDAVHEHLPLAYAMLGDTMRALDQLRLWRSKRNGNGNDADAGDEDVVIV